MTGRPLRVAVIGPVAFPAVAGGLTRHCEELYTRLAARGVDATVYVRKPYMQPGTSRTDVRVVALPVPRGRGLETLAYGLLATLRSLVGTYDVVHYHGVAAGAGCALQRLRPGRKLVFTHHRADWRDEKWGRAARALLRATALLSLFAAHAVIAVSHALADELRAMRDREITVIGNGITLPPVGSPDEVTRLGLEPGRYAIVVGRVVPEKGVHVVVDAMQLLSSKDVLLAVVGAPRYSQEYAAALEQRAGRNVRFLGQRSGTALGSLYANAALFVTASGNEGYPIGVLEALGFGLPIVASDIPAHREVLQGTDAAFFPVDDSAALATEMDRSLGHRRALAPIDADAFSWDAVAERTLDVLRALGAR